MWILYKNLANKYKCEIPLSAVCLHFKFYTALFQMDFSSV
jgi:hypothetical protein